MKSPKPQVWKFLIALTILVSWGCLDGIATVTTSEVQSLRHKKDKEVVDVGKSLVEIAECASRDSVNQAVDLVFVIDGSFTMKDLGKKVEERIADMARVFEESAIDYQFALIWYQNFSGRQQITVKPLQRGLLPIQENFRRPSMAKFMGPVAGYGLDAVMKGLTELSFRWDAEKHFVVVTNAALKTAGESGREKNEVVNKILDWCELDEIRINVIGISERIQIQLADQTGGKWYGIHKKLRVFPKDR